MSKYFYKSTAIIRKIHLFYGNSFSVQWWSRKTYRSSSKVYKCRGRGNNPIYLYVLYIYLSTIQMNIFLSIQILLISNSLSSSLSQPCFKYANVYLSIYVNLLTWQIFFISRYSLPIYLIESSIYLSIYLSVYLSNYLSMWLCDYVSWDLQEALSIYLSRLIL